MEPSLHMDKLLLVRIFDRLSPEISLGKTFTMSGTGSCPGIMQQAVEEIFRRIRQTPTREFLLRVSYLEIYNEIIRDLMNAQATNLKIKTNTNVRFSRDTRS